MAFFPHRPGSIEVICGSMFSGKSEELIRRLRLARIAHQRVQVFKPTMDTRYAEEELVSHSDFRIAAKCVHHAQEILLQVHDLTAVIGIDEVQFFDESIVDVCNRLANQGKRVIVAETGWPGRGQTVSAAEPSPENAMRYFIDTQDWAQREGVQLFYFSSFDEPWKLGQEGEVGAQWGLWDKDERPKYGAKGH